ncbi:MAG: LptF/LptG family permease [Xanthomonadaceae bacterium]|nr:LptF/LptG family permease [Xanthomonadaceae bacterium]
MFIHYRDQEAMTVSLAERAEQRTDPVTGVRHLVLHDGRHYSGVPGSNEYRAIEFSEHGLRIELGEGDGLVPRRTVQPTGALFRSDDLGDIAELQWRISVPLMGFLLVLLAVPLGRTSPRQGRYGKLFAAILVYVVYSNLIGLSQVWIERGQLSPWIGVWWVHAAVLLLTAGLVVKHYGWRYSLKRGAEHRSHTGATG